MRILVFLCLLVSTICLAGNTCQGRFANPLTDVCWNCLFPITIGTVPVLSGDVADTVNPKLPICSCPIVPVGRRIGISTGYWEPIALADVTVTPYCMVNLGGMQLTRGQFSSKGEFDKSDPSQGGSFYYVHWYKFPLLYWLNLLTDGMCVESGDFDIAYLTELDPTWRDDELTFILNPEVALFANPIAQAACSADAVASTLHLPLDPLFWCAGSHGSIYPMNGWVQEQAGGVQASLLLAERMAYKMHREGLILDSVGVDGAALCFSFPTPIIPKSRYRTQMINPIPTATTGNNGCHPFGHSTVAWQANHEDFKANYGYLFWRKRNCCAA